MTNDGLPRFTIDTGIVIAAMDVLHQWHTAASALDELAARGAVQLGISTAFDYDLETAPAERGTMRRAWLDARPYIARLPGPFAMGITRLDGGDVLVDDETVVRLALVAQILAPTRPADETAKWRRKSLDIHHVRAHVMSGYDALVTTDQRDILNRAARLWELAQVRVLNPEQAVRRIGGPSGGAGRHPGVKDGQRDREPRA